MAFSAAEIKQLSLKKAEWVSGRQNLLCTFVKLKRIKNDQS